MHGHLNIKFYSEYLRWFPFGTIPQMPHTNLPPVYHRSYLFLRSDSVDK